MGHPGQLTATDHRNEGAMNEVTAGVRELATAIMVSRHLTGVLAGHGSQTVTYHFASILCSSVHSLVVSFADATIARLPGVVQPYAQRHHELIKFAIVGGTTFIIDTAIFYTLKLTVLGQAGDREGDRRHRRRHRVLRVEQGVELPRPRRSRAPP